MMGNEGLGKRSSSGLGASHVLQQPSDFASGSLGWETLARAVTDPLSNAWFSEYGPKPATKILGRNAFVNQDRAARVLVPSHLGAEEVELLPDLTIDLEMLGERVALDESAVGRALIEALERNGIHWAYRTAIPVDHFNSIDIPDLRTEGVAQWGTYFDMPLSQFFSVFRNIKGVETVYWSAPMLVSTRAFTQMTNFTFAGERFEVSAADLKKGALPFGEWSPKLVLPALFKSLFYLSETPFPSQIMSMSRSIAFKDLPTSRYPRPAIVHHKQHFVQGAFDATAGDFKASGTLMPDVIEAGWIFSSTEQSEIQTILEVVTNGLVRMATYLEDGYLNYRKNDYPFAYDSALLAGVVFNDKYEPGVSALGLSQWIPGVRIGLLLNETNELGELFYADSSRDSASAAHRHQAELIVNDGAGVYVPSLINTLVFSWLFKECDFEEIDQLLDTAIRLEIPRETTIAMSNLGISKYLQGEIEEAIRLFTDALAREDGAAEDEASFYLARIFSAAGESKKAVEFENRCTAAGGYETFDGADSIASASGPSPAPARVGELPKAGSGLGVVPGSSPAEPSGGGLPKASGGGLGSPKLPSASGGGLPKANGGGLGGPPPGASPSLPKANGGVKAKFCSGCGTAFSSDDQKFCPQCGAPRG
jgi:hypothetical protein